MVAARETIQIKGILAASFAAAVLLGAMPSFAETELASHGRIAAKQTPMKAQKSLQDQWSCYNDTIEAIKGDKRLFFDRRERSKEKIEKMQEEKRKERALEKIIEESFGGSEKDQAAALKSGTWQNKYVEDIYEAMNALKDDDLKAFQEKRRAYYDILADIHAYSPNLSEIIARMMTETNIKPGQINDAANTGRWRWKKALETLIEERMALDSHELILARCFSGAGEPAAEKIFSRFDEKNIELTGEPYKESKKNEFMAEFGFEQMLRLQSSRLCLSQAFHIESSDKKSIMSLFATTCRTLGGRVILSQDGKEQLGITVHPHPAMNGGG